MMPPHHQNSNRFFCFGNTGTEEYDVRMMLQ